MQLKLSQKLVFEDCLPVSVEYVAGVTLTEIEFQISDNKTRFPYIPTLLSFREIPPVVSAIRKLGVEPDVFLVDGQGYAHPYGLGFASHLGLILDKPTIGVAKSLLYGKVKHNEETAYQPLIANGKIVGAEVITREGTKPLYVSVGHEVSLRRAVEIVLECTRRYKLPEPIRSAHRLAGEAKRQLQSTCLR